MRIRSLLLTSATSVGLLIGSSALFHEAYAQKGNFMEPSTAWAVNKVAGKSEGKGGYCAVARHFDGNTILTLARNERSETSFALDFPRLKFKNTGTMRITLDPGAGVEREFDVDPVSQKAFVVRLGKDPAFFNALGKTGLLRVEMPDESYVFNISDIDSGQFQLDYCLASLQNKDPAPVPAVESFPTDEMIIANAGDDDAAETTDAPGNAFNSNALREENERLRAALKNQSKITPDPVQSAKTGAELSVLKSQLDRAKSDNARLLSMINEIEGKAKVSEDARIDAAIADEKIAALEAENNKLQARVQNLSQSLQGYKAVDANKEAWEDEKGLLRNALKKEQEESAEEKAALEGALEAEKEKAAQEKSALEQKAAEEKKAVEQKAAQEKTELEDKAAEEKAELEEKVSSLVERNVKLVQTIKGAKSAIGDLTALRDNVEATNSQNAELKARSSELEQQLASVQEEADKVAAEKEQQIAKLELEVDRLSEETQVAQAGSSSLEEQLASLKAQNEEQAKKLAQSEIELAQLAELKSSNEALFTQLASFQEKFEANKAETKLSQSEIEAENSKLLAENTSLKSQASAMKEALQVAQADISAKISGFNEKVAGLKEQLADKTAEVMRLASVEGELEAEKAKTERLAVLESELEAEKEKTARLASVEGELEAEKEKAARLAALEGELDSEKAKTERLAAIESELEEEKAKTEQLASVEEALAAEKAKNAELEQQVAALEGDLKVASTDAVAANEKDVVVASLEGENTELKSLLEKAKAKIEGLLSDADNKASELAELQQRNEALEGQLELAASLIENSPSSSSESVEVAAVEPEPEPEPAPKAPEDSGVSANASLETIEEITLAMAPAAPEAPKPKVDDSDTAETSAVEAVTAKTEYVRDDAFAQANYIPKTKPAVPARMQATQAEAVEVAEVSAEELASIETAAGDEEPPMSEEAVEEPMVAEETVEEAMEEIEPEPTPVLDTEAVMAQEAAARAEAQDFMDRNLSEAQIYEEQMKRKLANEESVAVSAPEPMDENVNAELEAMEAAAKAEAEEIVEEKTQVVKQVVETPKSVLSSGNLSGSDISTVPQIPSIDEMNAGQVPEPIQQVKQAIEEPPVAEMPVASVAPSVSSASAKPISDVLSAAKVASSSAVSKVNAASGADVSAYQWRSGAAYGSGEQRMMASSTAFDAYVKEYLSRTESRCKGDFAIVPDNSRQVGAMRIDSYEVACVGQGVSSAAAIVFYNDGGTFNVVAHEADAAEMDMVMEIRDKVFSTLAGGSKT